MTEIMLRIKEECEDLNISQRDLAERSGLTEASISRYFNDQRNPNIKNVEAMAKALGLKILLFK